VGAGKSGATEVAAAGASLLTSKKTKSEFCGPGQQRTSEVLFCLLNRMFKRDNSGTRCPGRIIPAA
jgi:hypothetical protein